MASRDVMALSGGVRFTRRPVGHHLGRSAGRCAGVRLPGGGGDEPDAGLHGAGGQLPGHAPRVAGHLLACRARALELTGWGLRPHLVQPCNLSLAVSRCWSSPSQVFEAAADLADTVATSHGAETERTAFARAEVAGLRSTS